MLLYRDGAGVLRERFEAALRYVDRVDVLVGFFWFSGLKVFEAALRAHPEVKLRVLVGMAADVWEARGQVAELAPVTQGKDDATLADEAYERLGRVLQSGIGETRQDAARQAFFAELLEAGRLEVRQTRRPNHAKVWLFHHAPEHQDGLGQGRLITGSSNFSRAALKGEVQDELDVELMDWGYPEAQGWFDALWADSVPLDPSRLAGCLRSRAALTPFEAFALALDTVVQAEPENPSLSARIRRALKDAGFQEFAYQRDAVVQACEMLETYGGALVADVVGLGKSVIAMLVASASDFGHTGLILCPPGLVENWKGYRKAFGLGPTKWPVLSSGDLEKVKALLQEDAGFQMVIVDEAHRFRNADGQQYADLQTICRGRRVLLLTATPLNNRLDDLAAFLGLFLPTKNNPMVYGGDLPGYLRGIGGRLKDCQEALRLARTLGPDEPAKAVLDVGLLAAAGVDRMQAQTLRGREATLKVLEACHKQTLGKVRELLEKVTIRRNRLDLLEDPIYRKSLPPLSRVCDPGREFFALDDAQDAFYDRIITEVCRDILAGEALKDPNPSAPRRKILIFSEFADTVAFLGKRLEKAFPGRVCVVRDLGREKRDELRANFDFSCPKAVQRDDYDILVGTDKISEGLNLNRAGVAVNYDIPWNPTRVLQRLGRINRIGGKVFDELHTLNFFPTRRGADVVGNERIAKEKLFNIQKTLGEDVKLFEEGEEPSAAELWERLNGDKEESSAITKWRGLHAELAQRYPNLFEQVAKRAPNAKSARAAVGNALPGTYQLRTLGALPQALARINGEVIPIAPTALLEALRCEQDEPLQEEAVRGKTFWEDLAALAEYRDASREWATPTLTSARDNLARMEQIASAHAEEVRVVRKALNEGRLANWWIKQLGGRVFVHDRVTEAEIETYAKTLRAVLAELRLAGASTPPPAPVTQLSVALTGPSK